MEYDCKKNGDNIFKDSLRSARKSPLKHFADAQDKSDITNYLNYKSNNGRLTHRKNASMQKDLL
jgi:hypothetical protein